MNAWWMKTVATWCTAFMKSRTPSASPAFQQTCPAAKMKSAVRIRPVCGASARSMPPAEAREPSARVRVTAGLTSAVPSNQSCCSQCVTPGLGRGSPVGTTPICWWTCLPGIRTAHRTTVPVPTAYCVNLMDVALFVERNTEMGGIRTTTRIFNNILQMKMTTAGCWSGKDLHCYLCSLSTHTVHWKQIQPAAFVEIVTQGNDKYGVFTFIRWRSTSCHAQYCKVWSLPKEVALLSLFCVSRIQTRKLERNLIKI